MGSEDRHPRHHRRTDSDDPSTDDRDRHPAKERPTNILERDSERKSHPTRVHRNKTKQNYSSHSEKLGTESQPFDSGKTPIKGEVRTLTNDLHMTTKGKREGTENRIRAVNSESREKSTPSRDTWVDDLMKVSRER